MKRKDLLAAIRVAGYHEDQRQFIRLLVENRISRAAADQAWRTGQQQKRAGVKCSCYWCEKEAKGNPAA